MAGPALPPQFRNEPPQFRERRRPSAGEIASVEPPPQFGESRRPSAGESFSGKWKWIAAVGAVVVAAIVAALVVAPNLGAQGGGEEPSGQTMTLAQQQRQPQTSPSPARPGAGTAGQQPQTQQQPAAQQEQPAVPQRSERIVQDSWTINCVQMKVTDPKKTCSAVLQVIEQENKRVVFAWVIGRTPEGATTTVFQTPTRVLLQKGVELKLGNAAPRKANFVICTNQSCEASLTMDDAVIREAIAAANGNAVATITLADGRAMNFTMPIKGIDKVLSAIR